ncbi:DUF2195 family protein [Bordetella sp. 2513F-2]
MSSKHGAAMLLAGLMGACGPAVAGPVSVENPLQACVAVQPGLQTQEQGVLLQQVDLQVARPIGECGCKSALMGYTASVVLDGDARSATQSGVVNARRSGARTLPLATDAALVGDRPVVLALSCATPD